jgi:hypothetical protein
MGPDMFFKYDIKVIADFLAVDVEELKVLMIKNLVQDSEYKQINNNYYTTREGFFILATKAIYFEKDKVMRDFSIVYDTSIDMSNTMRLNVINDVMSMEEKKEAFRERVNEKVKQKIDKSYKTNAEKTIALLEKKISDLENTAKKSAEELSNNNITIKDLQKKWYDSLADENKLKHEMKTMDDKIAKYEKKISKLDESEKDTSKKCKKYEKKIKKYTEEMDIQTEKYITLEAKYKNLLERHSKKQNEEIEERKEVAIEENKEAVEIEKIKIEKQKHTKVTLGKLTIPRLKDLCKHKGITNYSNKKKSVLIEHMLLKLNK